MATPYIKSYINSIQNQRPYNEDDFVCYDLQSPDKEVCFVIDGCGAAGDVGAVVTQYAIKLTRDMDSISTKQIESLFIELNNYIFNYRKYSSVGCYVGTLLFVDNAQKIVRIASCGDVRTYFLHNDNLTKVTPDDSIVGALEDKGAISEAEAKQHPHRNMITQCCGKAPHIPGDGFAHMAELTFEVGD